MSVNTPKDVIESAVTVGKNKVALSSGNYGKFAVLSMLAGVYIAFGGILSLTIGFGFPEITAGNPSLQKMLSGFMFPIGLILVVLLGAELFTGNNALLIPAYMKKHYGIWPIIKNWILVYFGNLVGALAFTYFMVYQCGLTAADPYHSAIIKIA